MDVNLWRFSGYISLGRLETETEITGGIVSSLVWEPLGVPQEELESVTVEKDVFLFGPIASAT